MPADVYFLSGLEVANKRMRTGGVIQGFFPNGLSRITAVQPMRADAARPEWVQRSIGASRVPAAVQRHAAPQPAAVPGAIPLPPNLSRFGAGAGQPLPGGVRQRMEAVFGTSFADVRVHVGPEAASLGALAFTHGSNIHFAHGQYDPSTPRGLRILGHELAHVVQQRAGRVRNPFGSGLAVVHDATFEAEAERMATRAAAPWHVPRPLTVQRAGGGGRGGGGGGDETKRAPAGSTPSASWVSEVTGDNYRVIVMTKTKERLAKAAWSSAIDHAVICFQAKCYGWGNECTVTRDASSIYHFDMFFGKEFARPNGAGASTVTKAEFDKRRIEWMKLNTASKASRNYPANCRGFVDFVIGLIDAKRFTKPAQRNAELVEMSEGEDGSGDDE
jgi:hypothetical protein